MHDHNWLAIAVAAVAAFLIGGLWYSPLLFAKQWMVANLIPTDQMETMKSAAPRAYAVSIVCFFVMGSSWRCSSPIWERRRRWVG